MVDALASVIRRCEAAQLDALARVEETGVWAESARSVRAWAARHLDVPFGRAEALVGCATALRDQPHTAQLAASGAVGVDRLIQAAATVAARPDVAAEVCAAAASSERVEFKNRCRRWRHEHEDDEARARRHRDGRRARVTVDDEGRIEVVARGPAVDGVEFRSLFKPWVDQLLRRSWEQGDPLTPDQARWDALLAMARAAAGGATGGAGGDRPASLATGQGSRTKTLIRVDLVALLRAAAAAGELCELPGLGDLDVATVRRLIDDGSFVSLIFTAGHDDAGEPIVTDVAHLGRSTRRRPFAPPDPSDPDRDQFLGGVARFVDALLGRAAGKVQAVDQLVHDRRLPNAAQRSVLEFRHPTCSVPGCTMTEGLQNDHELCWIDTGETRLDQLNRKCARHHRAKTARENAERTRRRPAGGHDPPDDRPP